MRLVCQDRVHPLLDRLERWGRDHGVPVTVQVSDDLRADLATLTSATTLCISQGALGLASTWLSASAERVYLPRGAHTEELRALGTTVVGAPSPPRRGLGRCRRSRWPAPPARPTRCLFAWITFTFKHDACGCAVLPIGHTFPADDLDEPISSRRNRTCPTCFSPWPLSQGGRC